MDATLTSPTLRLGARRYPVVPPSVRDPRVHLAAVILSIHVLGQVGLGFRVSVVQILAAILTCAVIEVAWTLHRTGTLVWPASALLTGSAVALILRVLGTENGDYWSTRGWYVFALAGGLALLTKYAIKFRGSHVFNPANVALVAAFLVLGSARVEPLDFWWGPLDGWLVAAYAIILAGGLLITRRLHLLAMSAAFWITLAAGIGVLAASGHCMTARWAFGPVCGSRFWWVIVTSPEILIFVFFMITDPKTVPAGRVARIAFGVSVAVASTLLIGPQTTEFGAKVGLLAGLVILCVARLPFARLLPAADSDRDRLGIFVGELARHDGRPLARGHALARGAIVGSAAVFLVAGVVAAGAPSRELFPEADAEASPELAVEIDPAMLPRVTVDAEVSAANADLAGAGAREVAMSLAEDLEIEMRALLGVDMEMLRAADSGARLLELESRIDEAVSTGATTVRHYTFDSLHLAGVVLSEAQAGLSIGVDARGTVEEITYADGDQVERTTSPFALTFVLSKPTGTRWLIVETWPLV